MKKAVGIDIGGTKIAAGIVFEDGRIQHETKILSEVSTKEAMFDSLCTIIDQVLTKANLANKTVPFGIGVPGLVNREKGIAVFQNNLPWENFPLADRLRAHYPTSDTIVLDNDVYQAAYAEWRSLHLKESDSFVFLTVSTGISTAIINGGKFIRGKGFAGELGLLPVRNKANQPFYRLEKIASGPALAEKGRVAYNDGTITTEEVFTRYRNGDEMAKTIISEWVLSLTHGIYSLICILDPQKIVLGGSVIQKNPEVLELIKRTLSKEVIPAQKSSLDTIEITKFENNAGVIGAGLSAIDFK